MGNIWRLCWGILNPLIASFAFYLIARTYELQKSELKATRDLLQVSTNAQKDQITLAALTALLNSNLVRIEMLNHEALLLKEKIPTDMADKQYSPSSLYTEMAQVSPVLSLKIKLLY